MAQYRWNRVDGKPFSSRVEILNHGRVLRIEKVQLSDAGRLRCGATNSLGASTAEVNLILKGWSCFGEERGLHIGRPFWDIRRPVEMESAL